MLLTLTPCFVDGATGRTALMFTNESMVNTKHLTNISEDQDKHSSSFARRTARNIRVVAIRERRGHQNCRRSASLKLYRLNLQDGVVYYSHT